MMFAGRISVLTFWDIGFVVEVPRDAEKPTCKDRLEPLLWPLKTHDLEPYL